MTATVIDAPLISAGAATEKPATESPAAPNPLAGNPGIVGIPLTIAGAIGLALANIGYLPAAAAGAVLPTIVTATAAGLFVTTIWAAALGQNVSASLFGAFFGFYASYAALALGLTHGWFGVPPEAFVKAQEAWFIAWIITLVMLTLTTLRLPWSFTLLLGLVDGALVVLLLAASLDNVAFARVGGWMVVAFIVVAAYLFADVMDRESGGRGLPIGRPLVR